MSIISMLRDAAKNFDGDYPDCLIESLPDILDRTETNSFRSLAVELEGLVKEWYGERLNEHFEYSIKAEINQDEEKFFQGLVMTLGVVNKAVYNLPHFKSKIGDSQLLKTMVAIKLFREGVDTFRASLVQACDTDRGVQQMYPAKPFRF